MNLDLTILHIYICSKRWGNTSACIINTYKCHRRSVCVCVKLSSIVISSLACMYQIPTSIYFYSIYVHQSWETHSSQIIETFFSNLCTGDSFLSICLSKRCECKDSRGWKTTKSPTCQKLKVEVSLSSSQSDMKRLVRWSFHSITSAFLFLCNGVITRLTQTCHL